ncbi:ParA family protein [Chromobacterium subtsugae]|uniref:ParA family protein n=1 Tax=Chromobacterium subtsugae TaxID=251747 RepID=A0ABS7FE80_9NEIS|nr:MULTISPECIES: ParA family protein [Chromobacterium]KUM05200.1 chromosome partitioning protein [Chromobacterium subtsugae]KZE83659.1 chromosome partitioning protein [Chromobacterium sp. F49]MBW7566696.1 ParA family protein [Chromobacterium subtsugae]MBW8288379.1 ParA family protein [Chromobacterium subtsugae]WSE92272.1 ParA family protein [Chromobacterium subtsugae]
MNPRVIAVANQKGGVGKTTTVVNLAAGLAELGKRVLIVDLDPQGNATMGSGIAKQSLEKSGYDVLLGEAGVEEARQDAKAGGYHVLPANRDLGGAELELVNELAREARLKNALAEVEDQYDYVLIDCPPSLNLLTLNGLVAAHSVLIPMVCEYYALEGLSDLVSTLRKVRLAVNPKIEIMGLLRTMFDARNNLSQQVSAQLARHFGDKVFQTVIPRNVRLAEAPSHGLPGLVYDRNSRGAQAYLTLAQELIERLEPATATPTV